MGPGDLFAWSSTTSASSPCSSVASDVQRIKLLTGHAESLSWTLTQPVLSGSAGPLRLSLSLSLISDYAFTCDPTAQPRVQPQRLSAAEPVSVHVKTEWQQKAQNRVASSISDLHGLETQWSACSQKTTPAAVMDVTERLRHGSALLTIQISMLGPLIKHPGWLFPNDLPTGVSY